MTTYVYETIPSKPGEKPRYFQIKQNMKDAPLTKHPKTGEPIRRVVLGGYGVLKSASSAPKSSSDEGGCCCGPGGCSD
jgi:predicted nucleic acid-binding Zn ribbon protein